MKYIYILFIFLFSLCFQACEDSNHSSENPSSTSSSSNSQEQPMPGVPKNVINTLNHVIEKGEAPEGYVGGRTFQNREKLLPRTDENGNRIRYQEWDVNEKVKNKNRGAERLVTGSDNSAYYTDDHYRSFKKIR